MAGQRVKLQVQFIHIKNVLGKCFDSGCSLCTHNAWSYKNIFQNIEYVPGRINSVLHTHEINN